MLNKTIKSSGASSLNINRGCWHRISRDFFYKNCQTLFYSYKFTAISTFFLDVVWLDQAFAHCPIFLTAATRKRLGRVSVPVWWIVLSDPLRIFGLVEHLPHQLPNPKKAHLLAFLNFLEAITPSSYTDHFTQLRMFKTLLRPQFETASLDPRFKTFGTSFA